MNVRHQSGELPGRGEERAGVQRVIRGRELGPACDGLGWRMRASRGMLAAGRRRGGKRVWGEGGGMLDANARLVSISTLAN